MEYIVHGSEDSLDRDIFLIHEGPFLPSMQECKEICDRISQEDNINANLVLVKEGVVVDCYKGTVDEVNNGMLCTYHLHQQYFYLPVKTKVERHKEMKLLRTIRGILSMFSRTDLRTEVKSALRAETVREKLEVLKKFDFMKTNDFSKKGKMEDIRKFFAFQMGQTVALWSGVEVYTKSDLARMYPELRFFLYREVDSMRILNQFLRYIIDIAEKKLDIDSPVLYTDHGNINVKMEKYMEIMR